METAKKPGTYGRSCRVCKFYFLTSDPNSYTCPWCQKRERSVGIIEADYTSESDETLMLVQEEVQ